MQIEEIEQKIVEKISSLVGGTNSMWLNYPETGKQAAEAIYRQHRTLQQSFWRLIASTAKAYTDLCRERGTDLRNEGAAEWTKKTTEANQDTYLPHV